MKQKSPLFSAGFVFILFKPGSEIYPQGMPVYAADAAAVLMTFTCLRFTDFMVI